MFSIKLKGREFSTNLNENTRVYEWSFAKSRMYQVVFDNLIFVLFVLDKNDYLIIQFLFVLIKNSHVYEAVNMIYWINS